MTTTPPTGPAWSVRAEYASISSPLCPVTVTVSASIASYIRCSPSRRLQPAPCFHGAASAVPAGRSGILLPETVLAVHSLDRLTRRIDDFDVLWTLLETERKILVSITEDIDFSTPGGLLEARRRVRLAQAELELIRRRAKAAYDAIVANGQYPGKQFPFGYIPARREPAGWILIPHPLYADVVREIADRLIVGESLGAICRWLNRTGIPTPRNAVREYKRKKPLDADAQWMPTSLTKILKSPNIVGQVTVNGIAVTRAEPLIDVETWQHVKQFLARNAARTGPKVNQSPLLGVLFCMLCKAPMYIATASYTLASGEAKKYRYYCCTAAKTWAQRWARSAWDDRDRLLLETGIRAEAARLADGTVKIEISGV